MSRLDLPEVAEPLLVPSLHAFVPDPRDDAGSDRDVYIDINRPGRYLLRQWTDEEWSEVHVEDRPSNPYRRGSTWFTVERVPSDAT